MVIYADVLFILNTVTDYFLIKLSGIIARKGAVFWRLAISAVLGGLSSFYILLPKLKVYFDMPIKLALCCILILIAYGFGNIKVFLKLTSLLFSLTFLLGGIVSAVVFYLHPENIYINNQVAYIDIDPLIFIVSGVGYYSVAVIIKHYTERSGELAKECRVNLYIREESFQLSGMIDTGNSLVDVFGMSEIIITDKSIVNRIYETLSETEKMRRKRAVPVKTISGDSVLDGVRIDKATITLNETRKVLINPIIVASITDISDGWDAIINPRSII